MLDADPAPGAVNAVIVDAVKSQWDLPQ